MPPRFALSTSISLSTLRELVQSKLLVSAPHYYRFVSRSFTLCLKNILKHFFPPTVTISRFSMQGLAAAIVFISLTKRSHIYLPWGGAHVAVLILSSWTDYTPEPHLWTYRSAPFSLLWCPRSLSFVNEIYCFPHELLRFFLLPCFLFSSTLLDFKPC